MAEDDHTQGERPKQRWYLKLWGKYKYHDDVKYLEIDYRVEERERQILRIVDDNGFKWIIFLVASSGFLASSYSLSATNVIMAPLYYVYPPCGRLSGGSLAGLTIDELTLAGSMIGMLAMGHLADRSGRKRWYGVELAVLIVATMGLLQASEGFMIQNSDGTYTHSMDIYSWIAWWRFVIGFGIGSEYPLSAVITAEWASTESRGVMLAAVFAMQSLGRLLVHAIGLAAIQVTSAKWDLQSQDQAGDTSKLVVDQAWRWTIGVGIIPAAFAILARLTIPETPRYYADIMEDLRKAVKNALRVYRRDKEGRKLKEKRNDAGSTSSNPARTNSDEWSNQWYSGAWDYLTGEKKAWRPLVLTSLIWAFMDVAWYGMSLDNPGALSILDHDPSDNGSSYGFDTRKRSLSSTACSDSSTWATDYWRQNNTIHETLENNSLRSIVIISAASMAGSIGAILIIDRFRRQMILVWSFLVLSLLFTVAGGTLVSSYKVSKNHVATTVFFAILQFVFNIGPNTLTFVIPAEIFPTVYRGTFYGIAAASGKFGAIIIRLIIGETTPSGDWELWLGKRLLAFIPFMFLCAGMSWFLPNVQYLPSTPSSQGGEGQVVVSEQTQPQVGGTQMSEQQTPAHQGNGSRIMAQQAPEQQDLEPISNQTETTGAPVAGHAAETASFSSFGFGAERRPSAPVIPETSSFWDRLKNKALEDIAPNPAWEKATKGGKTKEASGRQAGSNGLKQEATHDISQC